MNEFCNKNKKLGRNDVPKIVFFEETTKSTLSLFTLEKYPQKKKKGCVKKLWE